MTDVSPDAPGTTSAAPPVPTGFGSSGLEGFAPYLMNRIMGRYNAALRAQMARHGLTTPQMRALAVLSVIPDPSIRDLAVHAVVEQSTLSRALDRLEAEGLVARHPDPRDSRTVRVAVTDPGRALFATLWPHMAAAEEALFAGVAAPDRRRFVALLRAVLRNLERPGG